MEYKQNQYGAAGQTDEHGNPIRQTDEYGNPVNRHTGTTGNYESGGHGTTTGYGTGTGHVTGTGHGTATTGTGFGGDTFQPQQHQKHGHGGGTGILHRSGSSGSSSVSTLLHLMNA